MAITPRSTAEQTKQSLHTWRHRRGRYEERSGVREREIETGGEREQKNECGGKKQRRTSARVGARPGLAREN